MGKSTKKSTKTPKATKATGTPVTPAMGDHAEKLIEATTRKGNDDGTLNDDINTTKRTHDAVTFSPHGARVAATNPHGTKNARALQDSPCKKMSSLRHGNIYPNSEDSFGEEDEEDEDSPIPFHLPTTDDAGDHTALEDAAPTAPNAVPADNAPADATPAADTVTSAGPTTTEGPAETAEPPQTVETLVSDNEEEGVSTANDIIRDPHLSAQMAQAVGESLDAQEAQATIPEAFAGDLTYEDLQTLQEEQVREGERRQEALAAYESPPSPAGSTLSYMTDPMEGTAEAEPTHHNEEVTQPSEGNDIVMQGTTTAAPSSLTTAPQLTRGAPNTVVIAQDAFPTPSEAYGTSRNPQGTPRPPFASTPRTSQRPRSQTPAAQRAVQAATERRSAAVGYVTSNTTTTSATQATRNTTPIFTFGGVTFNPVSTATSNSTPVVGLPQTTQRTSTAAAIAHSVPLASTGDQVQEEANGRRGIAPEGAEGGENRREVIDVDQMETDVDGDVTMVEANEDTQVAPPPLPKWKDEDTPIPPPRTDTTDIPTGSKAPTVDRPEHLARGPIPPDMREMLAREAARGRPIALAYGRYASKEDEPLVYANLRKDLIVHKAMSNAEIIPIKTDVEHMKDDIAGYVGGTPPRLYAILLGSTAQLDRLLAHPVYDTEDGDVFYFNYESKRASVLMLLHSPILAVTEGEQRLVSRITEDIRSAVRSSPKMYECVKAYNELVGLPSKTHLDITCILERVIDSLNIKVTAGGKDDGEYEWALHWKCATNDPDGERLYMNAARQLVIDSAHAGGLINANGGRIAWCRICRGTNHTSGFCPFPRIPGWKGPVYEAKATYKGKPKGGRGQGNSGGRARGGRGRGGRGRGRGY